jgi:Sulfotransferase domain
MTRLRTLLAGLSSRLRTMRELEVRLAEKNERLQNLRWQNLRWQAKDSSKTIRKAKGDVELGSLPDFLILGTENGGTTTLHWTLCQHPHVEPATKKEVHFFDSHRWFEKGIGWYRSRFPAPAWGDGRRVITGEASPYYLLHPFAPHRASITVPDAKLIALLRNPVDRAYSAYKHRVLTGRESLSFEEALDAEEERTSGELEKMLSDESYHSLTYSLSRTTGGSTSTWAWTLVGEYRPQAVFLPGALLGPIHGVRRLIPICNLLCGRERRARVGG